MRPTTRSCSGRRRRASRSTTCGLRSATRFASRSPASRSLRWRGDAESVLHGGPALLVAAGGGAALRAASAYSLLETCTSQGWRLAVDLERRLSQRTALIGASLVVNQPRLGGGARGFPYEDEALERIPRPPPRRGVAGLPRFPRAPAVESVQRGLCAAPPYPRPPPGPP